MHGLINLLFGCWHRNVSFPRTVRSGQRRAGASALTGTYVVCLDCGKEFAYDWESMQVITDPATRARQLHKPAESYAGK